MAIFFVCSSSAVVGFDKSCCTMCSNIPLPSSNRPMHRRCSAVARSCARVGRAPLFLFFRMRRDTSLWLSPLLSSLVGENRLTLQGPEVRDGKVPRKSGRTWLRYRMRQVQWGDFMSDVMLSGGGTTVRRNPRKLAKLLFP